MLWKSAIVIGVILVVVAPWFVLLVAPAIAVGASVIVVCTRGVRLVVRQISERLAARPEAEAFESGEEWVARSSQVRLAPAGSMAAEEVREVALSPFESQLMLLTAAGTSMRGLTAELDVTTEEVNRGFESLFRKLGVESRVELAMLVDEGGARVRVDVGQQPQEQLVSPERTERRGGKGRAA